MISNKLQDKLFKLAIAHSHLPKSTKKHFTFIVDRNKVLCFGYNNGWKSHTLAYRYGWRFNAIHSELAAILNFPYPIGELKHFTFVNLRIRKDMSIGMSKPCGYCLRLLSDFNVNTLIFTNDYGKFVEL